MENRKKVCQACAGYLFDDDDIVVCPVCGAPHHRDCYNSLGHCGVQNTHGTPNQYDLLLKRKQEKEKSEGDKVICPRCGKLCQPSENFCHNCSYPLKPQQNTNTPYGTPFSGAVFNMDPYGGVIPQTVLDEDVTAEDVKDFVGVNAQRYIPKFLSLRGRTRIRKNADKSEEVTTKKPIVSWNWAAFLFPAPWMFYRKMYFKGAAALILQIASTLCTYPFVDYIYENIPETATSQIVSDFLLLNYDKAALPLVLFLIGNILMLAIRVLSGMFGDIMYKSHCIDRIRDIKKADTTLDFKTELSKKGGVSFWFMIISFMVFLWVPEIIYAFL